MAIAKGEQHPIAITGIGIVSAIGNELETFWDSCLSGKSVVEDIPEHWDEYYENKSRFWSPLLLPEYATYGLRKSDVLSHDVAVLNSIVAADDALKNAGMTKEYRDERNRRFRVNNVDPDRCGVIIGTGLGCITSTFQNYVPHLLRNFEPTMRLTRDEQHTESIAAELLLNLNTNPRVNPLASCKSMANAISATLSIRYGFRGENETTVAACAAGSIAVAKGVRAIRAGLLDLVIVGGTEYYGDHAGGVFMAFDRLNTLVKPDLGKAHANRPFDIERSGFLFSQGAACAMVIESEEHASRRGATPIARIIGTAITSDAYSLVAISRDDNSIDTMIRAALADANVSPSDIRYVNAHGTATEQNDPIEASILKDIFGSGVLVNSTKSLLGHTIGASGAIETAVTALSIMHGKVHGSINLDNPISEINFAQVSTSADIPFALNQNFGFGGHNCGLVLAASP